MQLKLFIRDSTRMYKIYSISGVFAVNSGIAQEIEIICVYFVGISLHRICI